jgi:outer membrane protein assembly factor BamB
MIAKCLLRSILSLVVCAPLQAENWPAWRGPTGLGISKEPEEAFPLEWGPEKNVRWKVPLPGPGNSTPIVWEGRIFITQATDAGKSRSTLCLDRADGKILWRRAVEHSEPEPTHEDNPYCSASPATDGKRVVVFHGSAGARSYDLEGAELWRYDTGKLHHIWGNASSPVLHGNLCFLNCGPGDRTFLVALDLETGKKVWQVDIPGGLSGGESSTWTGSWSTPLVLSPTGAPELAVSYPGRLLAFEPGSGKEIWHAEGLGRLVYTSPVFADGIVASLSGFGGPAIAVKAGGNGDVTSTHRLWRHEKAQQRIGSGVTVNGNLYIVNEPGVAECLELRTGSTLWRERLGSTCWSSPVLIGSRLYVPDMSGDCFVFRASPAKLELLAKSSLGERTLSSFAVSNGEILIRTHRRLWCIAKPPPR